MDVPYALRITTSDRDRIAPAVENVPGVQAEPHERRVGASHQLVDLSRSFNVCPGMRMERGDQTDLLRAARDLVRTLREAQLRHLVQDALVGQHHTPVRELAHTPADRRGAYLHRRSSHRSRTSTTPRRLYLGIRRDGDIRVTSEVLSPHRICEGAHHAVGRDELRAHIARATGYLERGVPHIADHDAGERRVAIGEELEPRSRAVAHLDTDPASAAAVGLQIELGAARRFGHERPAETERLENRGDRPTVADVNPCRRSPERIGVTGSEIAPMQVMRVASTNCGVPLATTQEALPERQRSDVLLGPRAVPDLNRMKPRHALVIPRRPEWFRVADAHDGTALRG